MHLKKLKMHSERPPLEDSQNQPCQLKEGEASVLSAMSLIYNMLSIFKKIEQQG